MNLQPFVKIDGQEYAVRSLLFDGEGHIVRLTTAPFEPLTGYYTLSADDLKRVSVYFRCMGQS